MYLTESANQKVYVIAEEEEDDDDIWTKIASFDAQIRVDAGGPVDGGREGHGGDRRAMEKKAGVGARYVLVFQDGSRHPFNMVLGRKFTIGQIM